VAGGGNRVLEGHDQNVNGVAFSRDGTQLVSAGYDATVRIWPLAGGAPVVVTLPTPLNAVAIAPDGEIVVAGADQNLWFLSPDGSKRESVDAGETPIISVAISADGALVAAAGNPRLGGHCRPQGAQARAHARRPRPAGLVGRLFRRQPDDSHRRHRPHGAPLGRRFRRSSRHGRHERGRTIRSRNSRDIAARKSTAPASPATRFRPTKAIARGPTLHGIFGRRIATLPGYNFSPALQKMDIVWTPETVSQLFEVGPMKYTPGTKMPEQRITSADDRRALMDFLEKATTPK
jgi:cytochrome c